MTMFISLYWFTRIVIQFFYFDRHDVPKGLMYVMGEVALVSLFLIFTVIYFIDFLYNVLWI